MVSVEINIRQMIIFLIPAFVGTFIGNSLGFLLPRGKNLKTNLIKAFIGTILGFIIGSVISLTFFYYWKKSKIIQKTKILKDIDIETSPLIIKN
jgi:uncharacterized membrane protein YeaQ/YmgE (transglycosylase-associated protein family)